MFASPEPVTWKTLRPLLPDHLDPTDVLDALKRHCADRGVILVEMGGAWTFRTAPDLAPKLQPALTETRRLPRVAMETLVIIALHQPITRAEIEQIRGVSLSQLSMDVLLETGLIQPWGRREAPGAADLVGHDAAVSGAIRPSEPAGPTGFGPVFLSAGSAVGGRAGERWVGGR